jgi:uracil DNA glycosylase
MCQLWGCALVNQVWRVVEVVVSGPRNVGVEQVDDVVFHHVADDAEFSNLVFFVVWGFREMSVFLAIG